MEKGHWWSLPSSWWVGVCPREENWAITSPALWPNEAASTEPQWAATRAAAPGRTLRRSIRMCEQHFDSWPRKGELSKPPFMDPTPGAASRKKLFPHQSRKVGSCLLIEDHIKNARLQMFFLRTTEAGGWMWGEKKKFHLAITWDKKLPLQPPC